MPTGPIPTHPLAVRSVRPNRDSLRLRLLSAFRVLNSPTTAVRPPGPLLLWPDMLRFRRYRVFVACAVFVLLLLYRISRNQGWEDDLGSQFQYVSAVLPNPGRKLEQAELPQKPILSRPPTAGDELSADDKVKIPELESDLGAEDNHTLPPPTAATQGEKGAPAPDRQLAAVPPNRKPGKVQDFYAHGAQDRLHIQDPPGRLEPSTTHAPPVHWTKLPERFPVAEGSLIPLPTGTPEAIPTIQHRFAPETREAKEKREDRLGQVKAEAKIAWGAYRKYAFGHDEIIPINNGSRDPFCGWGATLVDSLDTLWIMGLKEEFEEAYNYLSNVDFTITNRNEIPVFETTIRYFGGLVAAYDVTGGHKGQYPMLLKKAVELAEILMGVFDTPNRMPILYYKWKPAFASQPKRASTKAGVAELGTLSMEFTRLAQLTGDAKYYDAVARVTNALDEWQNREDGTSSLVPGIFPENIDASGCNKSVIADDAIRGASPAAQQQAKTSSPHEPEGYKPKATTAETELRDTGASRSFAKRDLKTQAPPKVDRPQNGGSSSRGPVNEPLTADGRPAGWECAAQNLTASTGFQNYGMGGSQDSAYEYFPKQYLLLGGLETKYRSLHEKTVAAVKKYLLFKPMTPDNADILFSSKLRMTPGTTLFPEATVKREYEVTHLTCFLGGMFAMGGKIFNSEEDLDVARRLTDGCVWAYSSMPAGIMAEYSQVTPCQEDDACQWNETDWHLGIDPNPELRASELEFYKENLAEWEVAKQKALRDEAVRQQAEEELGIPARPGDYTEVKPGSPQAGVPKGYSGASRDRGVPTRRDDDVQYQGRRTKRDGDTQPGDILPFDPATLNQQAIEEKVKKLDAEFFGEPIGATPVAPPAGSFGGIAGQVPIEETQAQQPKKTKKPKPSFKLPPKPYKPQTHMEYVQERISSEFLPPGYTHIGSSGFQLR